MAKLILITVILGILSAFAYGLIQYGVSKERAEWRWQALKAVEAARSDEKRKQKVVTDATNKQIRNFKAINAQLTNDIDSLRNRPAINEVSRDTGASCDGANGLELAREYARFLIEYSAKAATQDAELTTCKAAYGSLMVK